MCVDFTKDWERDSRKAYLWKRKWSESSRVQHAFEISVENEINKRIKKKKRKEKTKKKNGAGWGVGGCPVPDTCCSTLHGKRGQGAGGCWWG